MLLTTFPTEYSHLVFSHTNHLYVANNDHGDHGQVYDMSADLESVSIKSFPLPSSIVDLGGYAFKTILPTLDESQILIHTHDIQVCSLKFTDHTHNPPCHDIGGINLSGDTSLLALATITGIEIWDAQIGQHLHIVQSQSRPFGVRPVAFSPKGELIVSSSKDGVIVVDVQAGGLLPTAYLFSPQGWDLTRFGMEMLHVRISFDSSKLAVINGWYDGQNRNWIYYLCVWDIPSGTLLHSLECGDTCILQWSCMDQYLLFKPQHGNPWYLYTETFQEEALEHPSDHFQEPNNHLYHEGNMLRIWLSSRREGLLFLALPSNLGLNEYAMFSSWGDWACIISWDGYFFLLNTSGLEAYMEISDL